jgi:t-SNARE complex subunit (syntaxin)
MELILFSSFLLGDNHRGENARTLMRERKIRKREMFICIARAREITEPKVLTCKLEQWRTSRVE